MYDRYGSQCLADGASIYDPPETSQTSSTGGALDLYDDDYDSDEAYAQSAARMAGEESGESEEQEQEERQRLSPQRRDNGLVYTVKCIFACMRVCSLQ